MDHPRRPKVSARDKAAIDRASDEVAAKATPLTDEQIAALSRVTRRPRRRRKPVRRTDAA